MTELYTYPYTGLDGDSGMLTHCSGPVIIHENKVLLHISSSTGKYQFIGGRLNDELSLKENAIATAEEVLGHRNISLHGEPLAILGDIQRDGNSETLILFHYQATLDDISAVGEGEWKSLEEILELESQDMISSKNIVIASKYFLEK